MELALRQRVVDALTPRHRPALDAFGAAITTRQGNRLPCWGDIAGVIDATITTDDDAVALWTALADVGEPRALAVVFDALRGRPAFLSALIATIAKLPVALQVGLVTQADVRAALPAKLPSMCAAAREALAMSGAPLEEERAVFDAFLGSLHAQRAGTFTSLESPTVTTTEASEVQPPGDHP
jgi:hypothetical protein